MRLSPGITRYELLAFANFKRGLKLVEAASWNLVDDEDEHPLKKVLVRLRSGGSITQVTPPMVIKTNRKKVVVEEEVDASPSKRKREEKVAEVGSRDRK